MELISIRQVSFDYGISRRMLCYYEEIGLIKSTRKDSSAYRLYDESAIKCLQQIIILRKLQIPMKQIKAILNNQNAVTVIEIFKRNINDIDEKITALSAVKSILERFVDEMREKANIRLELDVLNDKTMLAIVNTLSFSENKLKEKITMEELNKISSKLEKRTDVRIIYLPPATIATTKSFSSGHEQDAYVAVAQFAKDTNLLKLKPDARSFGFNIHENDTDGYEAWATIPDDMEVPAPFVKKNFPGGLYACHTRAFQDLNYDEVSTINDWIENSDAYCHDKRDPVGIYGSIEEHFIFNPFGVKRTELHIDFFMPVKRRKEKRKPAQLGYIEGSEEKCGFKTNLLKKESFYIAGYTKIKIGDEDNNNFYSEVTHDGRLERLKAALKPGAPIMIYASYDGECAQAQNKHGVFCHRLTICAAFADFVDPDKFITDGIFTAKVAAKHWLEFEFSRISLTKLDAHSDVKKLGWKFSGKGHFDVYHDGEILLNDGNKDNIMHFWMPVSHLTE